MAIRELSQIDPTYPIGTPMQYGFGRQATPPDVAVGDTILFAAAVQMSDLYGSGKQVEVGEIVMVSRITTEIYDVRIIGATGGQPTHVDAMIYREQATLPQLVSNHAVMFLAGANFTNAYGSGVDIDQGEMAVAVDTGGSTQVAVLGRSLLVESDPNNWTAPPSGQSAQFIADRTVEDVFGTGKQVSRGDMVFAVTVDSTTKVFIMDFESG